MATINKINYRLQSSEYINTGGGCMVTLNAYRGSQLKDMLYVSVYDNCYMVSTVDLVTEIQSMSDEEIAAATVETGDMGYRYYTDSIYCSIINACNNKHNKNYRDSKKK